MAKKANNHPEALGIYAYSITLSSESMNIFSSLSDGAPDLSNAESTLYIFKLDVDDTVNWTVTKTDSSGITSTLAGHTVTVTAMTVNDGYVEIRATKNSMVLTKRFNLAKTANAEETGIADYLKHKLIESDNMAYTSFLLAQSASAPVAYHYQGTYNRIYFIIYGTYKDAQAVARGGQTTGTWVQYYDIEKEIFSKEIAIPQIYPQSVDYHDIPAIIVGDNGRIISEAISYGY